MGVGKVVIYRMLLAYRYVNGESGKIERASRRIQSWYRGQRVRNCLRLLVFRVRMRSSYIPPSLRNQAQRASEFEQMMKKLHLPGMDGGLTGKVEMLQHKVEENVNQVRMLIVENRRMARTIDNMALLLRKMTLGIS